MITDYTGILALVRRALRPDGLTDDMLAHRVADYLNDEWPTPEQASTIQTRDDLDSFLRKMHAGSVPTVSDAGFDRGYESVSLDDVLPTDQMDALLDGVWEEWPTQQTPETPAFNDR